MPKPPSYAIVGLGLTGLSCARFCKARGSSIVVMDTRLNPPSLSAFRAEFPNDPLILGSLDEAALKNADVIVISPGLSLEEPMVAACIKLGKRVIGDVELFAEVESGSVAAITGTNGKSTVTTLVGEMIKPLHSVAVGGNLGIPVLDLYQSNPHAKVYVLELSSFQLETTYSLKPQVASILNITDDHMDRYPNFAAYQAAKQRIYHNASCIVFNRDDPHTYPTQQDVPHYAFTLGAPNASEFGILQCEESAYLAFEDQPLLAVSDLPVLGMHHQANALAALAIGYGMGLSFEPMMQVLKTFTGLKHRCEFVRELRGVRWINDSKGTNVGASQMAITSLGSVIAGKIVWIAGGLGKNADFSCLTPLLAKFVSHVILFGKDAPLIAAIVPKGMPCKLVASMQEAVQVADQVAKADDCVLLSPACASLDMFKDYADRGEVFMQAVAALQN